MRKILTNTLILCTSLLVALLIGEVAVRYAKPRPPAKEIADPVLMCRLLPGGEIDSRGFRNPHMLRSAEIVAIGDSQTYGNSATSSGSWPAQLGEYSGRTVYSMAVAGFGPLQYGYIFDDALALHPRVVIIGLYMGNDLFDAYNLSYIKDQTGYWHAQTSTTTRDKVAELDLPEFQYESLMPIAEYKRQADDPSKIFQMRRWMRGRVYLYGLLGDATRALREQVGLVKSNRELLVLKDTEWAQANPQLGFNVPDEKVGTVFEFAYRAQVLDPKDLRIQEAMRITKKIILETKKKADVHGVHFVIGIIPTKESAYARYVKEARLTIDPLYHELVQNEEALRIEIMNHCAALQIDCLDLTDALSSDIVKGNRAYPPTSDGHPVREGYGVIATAFFEFLKNKGFVM